jgi:glutamine synthetase
VGSEMCIRDRDGIDNPLTPPAPLNNVNVYDLNCDERKQMGINDLPGSLREALNELDNDEVVKGALGSDIYDIFTRAKWEEWNEYRTRVMDWEVAKYLETI